jgi:hypothetical protein
MLWLHSTKEKGNQGQSGKNNTKPCKKMWMIKMSTLKKTDEIKLKRENDSHFLNCDFLDTSIATDDPIEQSLFCWLHHLNRDHLMMMWQILSPQRDQKTNRL